MSLRAWLLKKLAGNDTVVINAKVVGYLYSTSDELLINTEFIAPPGDKQTRYDIWHPNNSTWRNVTYVK